MDGIGSSSSMAIQPPGQMDGIGSSSSMTGVDYTAEVTINVQETEQLDTISQQSLSNFYLGWERCNVTKKLRGTPYSVRMYRKGSDILRYYGLMKPLTNKHVHRVGFMFRNRDEKDLISGELLDVKLSAYVRMVMGCNAGNSRLRNVGAEEIVKIFTVQLLEAMDYLHKRNTAHGNLEYNDVFVSRDKFVAVGASEHAHLKLRLGTYETKFESYDAFRSVSFGNFLVPVRGSTSDDRGHVEIASLSDDCGQVVRFLTDMRTALKMPDTSKWLRFKMFVNSQKYIDKALIMGHESMWSIYVEMRFVRTLAPLWSSHVNKHHVQTKPFKSWIPTFIHKIRIMNKKLFDKGMKKKFYYDTLEGFSLMGKNALQHYNEYGQNLALSAELFFESLICFDPELIPKLVDVARQLNLMEDIMREICS